MKSCLQFLDLIVQDFSLGRIREIFRFLKLLQKQEILEYTFPYLWIVIYIQDVVVVLLPGGERLLQEWIWEWDHFHGCPPRPLECPGWTGCCPPGWRQGWRGGLAGSNWMSCQRGPPSVAGTVALTENLRMKRIQNELGLRLSWTLYLFSGVTSISALQGLNLIMQLQHFTLTTMINALVGLFVHYLSQHAWVLLSQPSNVSLQPQDSKNEIFLHKTCC